MTSIARDRDRDRRWIVADVRPAGLRDVLLVALGVVAAVAVAAALTALLPREGQQLVFQTPLLIVILVGGTAFVLWRILRAPRG